MAGSRVLFLPSWYPNERNPGALFVKEFAHAAALEHEVTVLFPFPSGPGRCWYSIEEEFAPEGFRIIWLRLHFLAKFTYLPATLLLFHRLYRRLRPEVIHAHVAFPAGWVAVLIGALYRIPVVLSEYMGPFREVVRRPVRRWIVKQAFARADTVLLLAPSQRVEMESCGLKFKKVVYVPCPVDTKVFRPCPQVVSGEAIKRILFVGWINPRKGISFLLRAVAELSSRRRDFVLDLVGGGSGWEDYTLEFIAGEPLWQDFLLNGWSNYLQRYRDLAVTLGVGELVVFHGWQDTREQIASFMQRCDFFVLPSLHENFGCVLAEAMACGKPVLATRCGGPEVIVTRETGRLVAPRDVLALAEGLEWMLEHHAEFDSNAIVEYARRQYSLSAVCAKLSGVYRACQP